MLLRVLIFAHRWVGVALCVILLIWFLSGIGMMYWTFPAVSARDRLERSPSLDAAAIALSPGEAAAALGLDPQPSQIRLTTFDGRPAYRISAGGRGAGGGGIVYADRGEEHTGASRPMRDRVAGAWTGQPSSEATVERVTEVDQWTVGGQLRTLRPLWKYSWPNGEQLYIGEAGEVLQYTTTASRLGAYVSAIPHWFYFTPIRQHQPQWLQFMIWSAGISTVLAIAGLVIALWRYSPSKRYRMDGAPTSIPYRGQKRLHTILGFAFGIAAATWAFSGMLSLDPFPRSGPGGGARASAAGVAANLRGRVDMQAFAGTHPRDVVARNTDLQIKELELTSFAGEPLFAANLADGTTRLIGLDGTPVPAVDHQRITDAVARAAPDPSRVETRIVTEYDWYYRDRTRQRPLPVVLALTHDDRQSRFYIDPATARVVGSYNTDNWVGRWLYNGLHSLDFPWLYNYRPLWDIVVIAFMLGGTALCLTSLVLAWRVVGRALQRVAARASGRSRAPYAAQPAARRITRVPGT